MKAVSGKTWVQKAVFLEPKPLFSSAFTMCSRGWYLCMELRMIWAWGEEEDISWEWRGGTMPRGPQPADRERKREGPADTPKKVFFLLKSFSSSASPLSMDITCAGGISPQKSSPPTAKRAHQGLSFHSPQAAPLCGYRTGWVLTCCPPCSPGLCCCVSPPRNPNTRFHSQRGAVPTPAAPTSTAQASQPPSPVTLQDMGKEAGGGGVI